MNTTTVLLLLLTGLIAGALSSLVGIGGGIVIVPVLVIFFHFDQTKAQGTSLAMLLPPIGILGVWEYYKKGQVDLKVAGLLCLAFLLGSFFGAKLVMGLDKTLVKRFFALFMIAVAIKFLFFDKPAAKTDPQHNTAHSDATVLK